MTKVITLVTAVLISTLGMTQTGTVKGTVRDDQGPIPGALVRLNDSTLNIRALSEPNGNFILRGIPKGKQTVVISTIGFSDGLFNIDIKEGEVVDLGTVQLDFITQEMGETVVTAKLPGEMRAINMKKNSDIIMDVISADGIGKLPDRNAGEAVQRVSGVSIEKDQGEGRFVSVRGLPSEWSSTTINGNRIPTAEEETTTRSTAFDFFPTDMIQMVQVAKAVTPDMEADAMGGSVNFITRTAPDKKTLNISLGGGANAKAGGPVMSGNILYGDLSKNKKFGFLLNGTYWRRDWATDNFEPRRGGSDGTAIRRLELRDYTGTRTTIGLNGAMEFNPSTKSKIYAKGMYGSLNDNELHYKHRLRFDKDRVEIQNIHDILVTNYYGFDLGGTHEIGQKSNIRWNLGQYSNEFKYGDIPNADNNAYWVVRFDQTNVGYEGLTTDPNNGKDYSYNIIDGGSSNPNDPATHLPSGFQVDPQQATFAWAELYKVYVRERDYLVGNVDFESQLNHKWKLKAGAKFRGKERIAEFEDLFYSWNGAGNAPTLADLNTTTQPGGDEYLSEIGSNTANIFNTVLTVDELDNFWDKYGRSLQIDSSESATIQNGGAIGRNFTVREEHISGYAMGTFKPTNNLTLVGGVRNTYTLVTVDGWEYDSDSKVSSPVTKTNAYNSLLPMLHAKYSPNESTNYRFAATRTFSRPSFGAIAPGGSFSENDLEYQAGNTELSPVYSWNFDVMAEKYIRSVGQITMGYFHKSIQNPIFETRSMGTYNGVDNVEITRPENGENAWLSGIEMGIIRKFDFLSGFWSGFGINANYTFMHSEMTIQDREEKVRIPRQASHLYNVALFYERGKFQARLALNHKGAYIMEHGGSAAFDEYFDGFTSMDFTASIQLTDAFMIYAEANNLLNQPLRYYLGSPERPTQVEYYGIRGQLGMKWNIF